MAVIVAENVSRRYGDVVAVDGVSLTVESGDVFALVGPNGAGKTTLIRALVGTADAGGRITVFDSAPRAVARDRIGMLPQAFDPPARLTARELLSYYASLYDESRDVEAVLAEVGVADRADTRYEALSGGQQRRTCVATALVNDPDLLVLDEPTTGVDPAGRRQLWERIADLAAGGTTVLLTTHYMEEAEELADRVGLLAEGSLVAVDTPGALVREHGGESLLRIAGEFDPGVADLLTYEATLGDGRLTVRSVPPERIGSVVETLADAGVTYDSIEWTEPDLEDVYLELTDRAVGAGGDAVAPGKRAGPGERGGEP
ncbi:MAG: ABC transporter ATP-binding protein [Salinirussus sp.]